MEGGRVVRASEPLEEALYALHFLLGGPEGHTERLEILEELRGAASSARDPVASVIAVLDVACDRLERGDVEGAASLRREADRTAGARPHPRQEVRGGRHDLLVLGSPVGGPSGPSPPLPRRRHAAPEVRRPEARHRLRRHAWRPRGLEQRAH